MISSNELLALSRLALSGKESDVRLYLAKMVRKLRKVDSKLGSDIEASVSYTHLRAHET